jgi:hypothetical protein
MTAFVCAYTGVPGDCSECGGHDPTGTGWCSHECREARAERVAGQRAVLDARRAEEAAFAVFVEECRRDGLADEQIDALWASRTGTS